MSHWYDKKAWRVALTIGLTATTAVFGGMISFSKKLTIIFIVLTVVSVVLQAILSAHYALFDKNRELDVADAKVQMRSYKLLFESFSIILNEEAEGINKIARDIKNNGIIPSDRWTFDKATSKLCQSIKRFIQERTNVGVNVYYVRTVDDTGSRVKMVGYANEFGDVPSTMGVERVVSNDPHAYFDIKMFANNTLKAEFRLTKEEVDKVFEYNDREKDSGKREQFLFIPVTCDKKRIMGLIEILVPTGLKIAEKDEDMRNIRKLLQVYSSIFILLNKAEKAAIAIPIKKNPTP